MSRDEADLLLNTAIAALQEDATLSEPVEKLVRFRDEFWARFVRADITSERRE